MTTPLSEYMNGLKERTGDGLHDICEKVGIDPIFFAAMEYGYMLVPVEIIDRICEAYDLAADEREDLCEAVEETMAKKRNGEATEMNWGEETKETGENIVYRLEVYKLGIDERRGEYCHDLAFCTGYATYDDACEGVDYIDDLLELSLDGWNPFTCAVIVKVYTDTCTKTPALGEWVFSAENMGKIDKPVEEDEE